MTDHITITQPGIYPDIPDTIYHADPTAGGSISYSGLKDILRTPALYHYRRTHPEQKRTYDFGHAVHHLVLGAGTPIAVLEYDNLRTKAAQNAQAEARAAGLAPLLEAEYQTAKDAADAVMRHPLARLTLERPGLREASAFAVDPDTGVWLRSRYDHLTDHQPGVRTVAVDLKTAVSADPDDFTRSAATYAYDVQAAFYRQVLTLARGDEDTAFAFIVVEKNPPHLVSVIELDAEYDLIGARRARRGIDTYALCKQTGDWPGYPDTVQTVAPPRWLAYAEELDLVF